MRVALLFLTVVFGLLACKKNKLDVNSFWQCNQAQHPDSATVSSKLIGSWNWAKQACGDGAGKTKTADKNIKLVFKTDHTFSVIEDANLLTQGAWKLVPLDGNSWGLDLSSSSDYLYGRILFCDNQVLFNDSYKDGCDHLFYKSN